jgi:hypothetical protein
MFTRLMKDRVTVRRIVSRTKRGTIVYEEVQSAGDEGPLLLAGKMDLRHRRVKSKDGTEKMTDGSFFYRHRDYPDLQEDDLVVWNGKTYRVDGMTSAAMLFTSSDYVRVDLILTKTAVPMDAHATETDA